MATTVETVPTISSSEEENGGYETEECDIDDGDSEGEDPTFDILEETRSSLSRMSLNKTRPRVSAKKVVGSDKDTEGAGMEVPITDEKDGKCIDNVEKMIKDGQVEKLKVEQCKVYLKNHGLRMTGNKNVLIGRIKEHLQVIDGGGEKIYPESSFLINCQGDACTGDVLMFEQKVYDMFNIASRSATGPPCGTRIVAGRVVKESYGAAKQQHTFTIEVLWSRGEKALPPLYPLLIKGRNLYRLKTVRQKWVDELERARVLQEKHMRGGVARYSREVRVREKEMKKNRGRRLNNGILPQRKEVQLQPNAILTQVQMPVTLHQKQHQHNNEAFRSNQYIQYQNPSNSNVQGVVMVRTVRPCAIQEQHSSSVPQPPVLKKPCNPQISNPFTAGEEKNRSQEHHRIVPQAPLLKKLCDPQISYNVSAGVEKNPTPKRQPFSDMNSSLQSQGVGHQVKQHPPVDNCSSLPHSLRQWDGDKDPISFRNEFNAMQPQLVNYSSPPHPPKQWHGQKTTAYSNAPMRNGFDVRQPMSNFNCQAQSPLRQPPARSSTPHFDDGFNSRPTSSPYRPQVRSQLCRYYLQGRCYYRENCRFLHE